MPIPQSGIFALGTRTHYHLELDLLPGVQPLLHADHGGVPLRAGAGLDPLA